MYTLTASCNPLQCRVIPLKHQFPPYSVMYPHAASHTPRERNVYPNSVMFPPTASCTRLQHHVSPY